jgi:sugar/nucleoside kinase (ribokinase family)
LSPEEALRRGVAAGSAACTIEGAQRSMPRSDQVDELLATMG